MGNYRNFTLTTYFVAHATAHITEEQLEEQLAFILKHLRLDKVYLEPFRGEMATHEQVEMCRRVFERHGIKVAGGLTTVMDTPEGSRPKARLFNTLCYNDPAMVEKLKQVSAFIGGHFDEFIIDDFFFTNCMCPDCVREKERFNQARGIRDGSWQAYRLDLMRRVSQEYVIGPAKAANPHCKITIKYPNWAESYQETGYNPKEQREMFDRIYTGTETRDPVTTDQHLPRYLSFSLMLGFQLDKLDAVLDTVGSPRGIACYLPDNCQGEDNVQDFLGMCGFPIVCTPYFPENEKQIMLTRSSACDPHVVEKLKGWLEKTGGDALITTGFIDAVQGKGLEALTSIRLRGRSVTVDAYRVEQAGRQYISLYPAGVKPIQIPVAEFRNNSTWAVVKGNHAEESYGLLLRDDYMDGHVWTLAVPDAFPDFYAMPEQALSRIRQAFPVEGVWLEGPARIGLFVYDNDSFIVYPFVMEGVQRQLVRLHVKGASALRITGQKRSLTPLYQEGDEAVFELPVLPGKFITCSIERS